MRDVGPFGMAGLWEHWNDPNGQTVESCTSITVGANVLIAPLHDRMPLIVAPGGYDAWLRGESKEWPHAVAAETLRYHPVSTLVGNARNDVPACSAATEED